MKRLLQSILFNCPTCHTDFEFDAVGEHEYVHCPVCGADHVTAKRGSRLMLEPFEQTETEEPAIYA